MASNAVDTATFEVIAEKVAARVVVLVPFLGWPGLNALFVFVLARLGGIYFEVFLEDFKFELVDGHASADLAAYDIDRERLRKAEMDQRGLDDAAVRYKKTLRDLSFIRSP